MGFLLTGGPGLTIGHEPTRNNAGLLCLYSQIVMSTYIRVCSTFYLYCYKQFLTKSIYFLRQFRIIPF